MLEKEEKGREGEAKIFSLHALLLNSTVNHEKGHGNKTKTHTRKWGVKADRKIENPHPNLANKTSAVPDKYMLFWCKLSLADLVQIWKVTQKNLMKIKSKHCGERDKGPSTDLGDIQN